MLPVFLFNKEQIFLLLLYAFTFISELQWNLVLYIHKKMENKKLFYQHLCYCLKNLLLHVLRTTFIMQDEFNGSLMLWITYNL